jgi:hypothetical protein
MRGKANNHCYADHYFKDNIMCLALYIGSEQVLPLIPYPDYPQSVFSLPEWPNMAQRFHTAALNEKQEIVQKHFSMPNIVFAGSYEGCSCGFNYGREYPDDENDEIHLCAARESITELITYIRNNRVKEIYACWFDDEGLSQQTQRTVAIEELSSPAFVFKKKELLIVSFKESDKVG